MSDYKTAFPDFSDADIPSVFLTPPWVDVSWPNDTCPSFSRTFEGGLEVHVYVDYDEPTKRDYWTAASGEQSPCPKFTVRATDDEGQFDDGDVGFSTDSLEAILDHVALLVGEVVR
jgi:hypothetical protein